MKLYPLDVLDNIDGFEFEFLIEELLKKYGFETEIKKQRADGGIDIRATNHQDWVSGVYIIQCKRQKSKISEPILRDLYGVMHSENANKGILVTNSYLTVASKKFVKNKPIEIIDRDKLIKMLSEKMDFFNLKNINLPKKWQLFISLVKPELNRSLKNIHKIKNNLSLEERSQKTQELFKKDFLSELHKISQASKTLTTLLNKLNTIDNQDEVLELIRELKKIIKFIEKRWIYWYKTEFSGNSRYKIPLDTYESFLNQLVNEISKIKPKNTDSSIQLDIVFKLIDKSNLGYDINPEELYLSTIVRSRKRNLLSLILKI